MNTCVRSRKRKNLLYYFPIIHTRGDMGGLEQTVRRYSLQRAGRQGWQLKQKVIQHMWKEIERTIKALDLDYPKTRIYQDGLPVCGKELDIVRDLARLGSPNHRLVLQLVEQGARLMGTESAELLVREYEVTKQVLEKSGQPESANLASQREEFLQTTLTKRDKFIAGRINDTLVAGDIGVVFLGMLHDLRPWLAADTKIICPLYAPLLQKGDGRVG